MNELMPMDKAKAYLANTEDVQDAINLKKVADFAQAIYEAQDDWEQAQNAKQISMRSVLRAGQIYDVAPDQSGARTDLTSHDNHERLTSKQKVKQNAEDAGVPFGTLQDWARYSKAIDRLDEYFKVRGVEHFREWTFADFTRWAFMHIPESTGDEWYTPIEYIRSVRNVLGEIDLDPASSEQANKTIKAKQIYTKEDDGLEKDWLGRVFMNPPYSKNKSFAEKLVKEFQIGNITEAIVLVGAHAIETQWFRPYWDHILCFTGHRIKFDTPEGEKVAGNINGSAFIYFGDQQLKFAKEFDKHGFVVKRWPDDF